MEVLKHDADLAAQVGDVSAFELGEVVAGHAEGAVAGRQLAIQSLEQ